MRVTSQRCIQHIRRNDVAEFSYRYNPETGRWEIITRHSDGTVEVLHKVKVSFDTPDAAMNHVALITAKRRRISPGKWVYEE